VERLLGEDRNVNLIRGYEADGFFKSLTRELGVDFRDVSRTQYERENSAQERLSNVLIEHGAESVENEEILEYLLPYVIDSDNSKPSAKRLLSEFGSLGGVLSAEPRRLMKRCQRSMVPRRTTLVALPDWQRRL
jgi:hypothetical protein